MTKTTPVRRDIEHLAKSFRIRSAKKSLEAEKLLREAAVYEELSFEVEKLLDNEADRAWCVACSRWHPVPDDFTCADCAHKETESDA